MKKNKLFFINIINHVIHAMLKNSSLTNTSISKKIITYFDGDDGHQTNPETGNLGFGNIHYAFIRNIKPNNILCIGSRKGYIPAICALACEDNKKGHVDFVDAGYNREDKNHWSGIGWWKKVDPDKHFSYLNLNTRISTYVMTTKEFVKQYPNRLYEYIYIDGDHSYKGVKLDYSLFWPKLTKYGFMIFHDVYVKHTKDLGNFGVWKLWRELKNNNKIIFPFPKDSGLGFIQKILYVRHKNKNCPNN
jgi:hypothetical protein